jgi:toxin ParE1/3/4
VRLVYRRRALADLESIFSYISKDNPRAAEAVIARIERSLKRVARFPNSARAGLKPGTREVSVPGLPYLAVYKVHEGPGEGFVEDVAVYHTARKRPTK